MLTIVFIFIGLVLALVAVGLAVLFNNRPASIPDLAAGGRVMEIISIYQDVRNELPYRREAIAALVDLGVPEALDALCSGLSRQQQPGLQKILASELPRAGTAIFPYLQRAFRNPVSRPGAVRVMASFGPQAAPAVFPFLLDEAGGLREEAAAALETIAWQPGRDEYAAAYWLARKQPLNCVQVGPAAVPALIDALRDPGLREGCISALGDLQDTGAGQALLNLGKDPRWSAAVINALARWKQEALPLLLGALRGPDPAQRLTAVSVLDMIHWEPTADESGARYYAARRQWQKCVAIGSPALAPLAELLGSEDPELRPAAISALGSTGLDGALQYLTPLLENPDGEARKQVVAALADIHSRASARALCGLLEDDAIYPTLQDALLKVGQPAREPLVICLRSENLSTRRRAAEILDMEGWTPDGQLESGVYAVARQDWEAVKDGGQVLVDLLIEELAHPQNCLAAAHILADTGNGHVIPAILQAIPGKAPSLQLGLAEALGKMGKLALEPLIFALDAGRMDRIPLMLALGQVPDARAGTALVRYLNNSYPHSEREAAARALGKVGEPALDAIFDTLLSPGVDPHAAGLALGEAGKESCQRLVDALKSKRYDAQVLVIALGRVPEDAAAVAVLSTLHDELYGQQIRNTAAAALVEIGLPALRPLIAALLHKPDDLEWISPLLVRFGSTAVEPLLKVLRETVFPAQANAVIEILGELGDTRAVTQLMDIAREHNATSDHARAALDKIWKKQKSDKK
jgi:HEAT repeat protein